MSEDRDNKDGLGRREFLAGLLAAGASATLAGCEKSEAPPPIPDKKIEQATRTDMIDALRASRAQFIDADGNPVNLNALQATLSGNPSTISFMFSACGDVCPVTGTVLQTLSQTKPRMKHVIVSVDPLSDFNNRKLANLMEAQGLKVSGPQANTIILYPTSEGNASPRSLVGGAGKALDVQHTLELWTNGRDVSGHSGVVTLFSASGAQLVQATNNREAEPMIQQLSNALSNAGPER